MSSTFRRFRPCLEKLEERDCPAPLPKLGEPYVAMVKDVAAGDSNPYGLMGVAAAAQGQADKAYFFASGKDVNDNEVVVLWASDGTENGTTAVATFDLVGGQRPTFRTASFKGAFYFYEEIPNQPNKLYVTTGNNPQPVKAFDGSDVTSPADQPMYLFATDQWLYFSATEPQKGTQLWRTDGTQNNTKMYAQINLNGGSTPRTLGLVGNKYLFVEANGADENGAAVGRELFVVDTTAPNPAGELAGDLNPGAADSEITDFVRAGEFAYFLANGKLYSYDPADAESPLTEIANTGSNIRYVTAVGTKIFWFGRDDNADWKLFSTTTSRNDASVVKDKNNNDVDPVTDVKITAINETGAERIVFTANTADNGAEPWVSDGTKPGTWMIADIQPNDGNSKDSDATFFTYRPGGQATAVLYFAAKKGDSGLQLYYSNGKVDGGAKLIASPDGQYQITGVIVGDTLITRAGSRVFFSAKDGRNGVETWAIRRDDKLLTLNAGGAGGVVWGDSNRDGTQSDGETGMAGVAVNLLDANDNVVDTTTTDAAGRYMFSTLPSGAFHVQVIAPPDRQLTAANRGSDDAVDSDIDPITKQSAPFDNVAGQTVTIMDAGLITPRTVGGRAWQDTNGNGIQDAGEPGAAGITFELLDTNGNVIGNTTTGADGMYLISGVIPGQSYRLRTVVPPGQSLTAKHQGTDPTKDSDFDSASALSALFPITGETQIITFDGGFVTSPPPGTAAVGDRVWNDANSNGVQDAGEAGLAGVTVRLFDASTGALLATAVTDGNGGFSFTDLPAGSYFIQVIPPAGYGFSPALIGDPALDSDITDPATGRSRTFILTSGQTDTSIDAGLAPTGSPPPGTASVGDRVWDDANGNGLQDFGEVGLAGILVRLLDSTGTTVIATTTTDSMGFHSFSNLAAGDYRLEFVPPSGYQFTTQFQGSDPLADSNVDPLTGRTGVFSLTPGQLDMSIDAGMRPI